MPEIVEKINKQCRMTSHQYVLVWIDFKNKKEIYLRPYVGSSTLADKCSKNSCIFFLKQGG